jgi:hypothetical protein
MEPKIRNIIIVVVVASTIGLTGAILAFRSSRSENGVIDGINGNGVDEEVIPIGYITIWEGKPEHGVTMASTAHTGGRPTLYAFHHPPVAIKKGDIIKLTFRDDVKQYIENGGKMIVVAYQNPYIHAPIIEGQGIADQSHTTGKGHLQIYVPITSVDDIADPPTAITNIEIFREE